MFYLVTKTDGTTERIKSLSLSVDSGSLALFEDEEMTCIAKIYAPGIWATVEEKDGEEL